MANELVRTFGDVTIQAREKDQYVDATLLCKLAGKQWHDYGRLKRTNAFLGQLESETGIPVLELVQVSHGGRDGEKGTWIHPLVMVNFISWASPKFEVQVTKWAFELMTTGKVTLEPGSVVLTKDQFDLLTGRMEHIQQQLDRLSAIPPAPPMLSPAVPRYTVRQRLVWHGWLNCPREMRRAITKHVKDLIDKFCEDTPHQAGGTAGGGPLVFSGGQLVLLDEAILHYRACAERARLADEQRQPTIPFPKDADRPAA